MGHMQAPRRASATRYYNEGLNSGRLNLASALGASTSILVLSTLTIGARITALSASAIVLG